MDLSEIYRKGEKELNMREIGMVLGGVETEFVLSNNRRVLDLYTIHQRCIGGVEPDTRCTVLGVELQTPIVMSAMTMPIPAIMENGLVELAKGLKEAGSLMWTGHPIPQNLAEIVATGVPTAANVKPFQDRRKVFEGIDKMQAAGVNWVGIEIDAGQGTKIHDKQRAGGCFPLSLEELKAVRERVSCPLIVKGVLSKEDAADALEAGADGIFISNHGAHTLDYLPHPFQVMDEIVSFVGDQAVILVDGGFRRGSDVFKGLAFGAQLVGLGRPILYALAANGPEGVEDLIRQITGEMVRFMSMTGSVDSRHVSRDVLIKE